MSEPRLCPQCGKKLRANNTGAECWSCRNGKTRKKPAAAASTLKAVKVKGDAVARFKVVAAALGFDGAGILEAFAQTWLDALRSKAETLASSPAPARAPTLAPVRLRPAAAVDDSAHAGAGA